MADPGTLPTGKDRATLIFIVAARSNGSSPAMPFNPANIDIFACVVCRAEAFLMMELPTRHATPLTGSRFAPIKNLVYGWRPWTGPVPDDLSKSLLVRRSSGANEYALAWFLSNSAGMRCHLLVSAMSAVLKKTTGSLAEFPVQVAPKHSQYSLRMAKHANMPLCCASAI